VLPHALYVAFVGGDHFEFRVLDLYLPFLFLLVYDGAKEVARLPAGRRILLPYLLVLFAGLVEIPYQSHRQFPDRYQPGFPGTSVTRLDAITYLDPARDPVYRWPILRSLARVHRDLLRETTAHFVGVRQEEHRRFLESVLRDGFVLRRLVEDGLLPADSHMAMSCVGAIPYISGLRTLDRLGLTDAGVARSPQKRKYRVMAHDKEATIEYARDSRVDFWALDGAHSVMDTRGPDLIRNLRFAALRGQEVYLAELDSGLALVGRFPMGVESARQRVPRLKFERAETPEVSERLELRAVEEARDRVRRDPGDANQRFSLGEVLNLVGSHAEAVAVFGQLTRERPDEVGSWLGLAQALLLQDRLEPAAEALGRALDAARRSECASVIQDVERKLEAVRRDLARETGPRRPS